MNNITQISSTPEFEVKTVHWKGSEYSFWVKVLSAKQAREIRQSCFDKNNISMVKAQERNEHLVSACVYVDKPSEESTKPSVEFEDEDGEFHELVRAFTKKQVEAMKEPLLVKIAEVCDEVNKTRMGDQDEVDLGN